MSSIITLICALIAFFAMMLLFPLAVAFATNDWQALSTFAILMFAYGFLAFIMFLAMAMRFNKLNRSGAFIASIALWLIFALIAIPPFIIIENLSLIEAIFESVSATITLGVSFQPLSKVSSAMEFYRSLVAWQGGLLTLLCAVFILGRYQVGGTPNKHIRLILHSSKTSKQGYVRTFFEVFVPYMALTIICAALLVIARIDPVDATKIALNTLSTNGYFPIKTGATILNNVAGEIIIIIFMLIGATSILWHRALFTKTWKISLKNSEVSFYFTFIIVVSIFALIGNMVSNSEISSFTNAIINSLFDVVSIMTTTGVTYNQTAGIALPIVFILALAMVGGSSFSTAGGFKIFRLGVLLRHSLNEIKRLVYPHMVIAKSVEEDKHEREMSKAIWSALFIAVLTIMLAMTLFSLNDFDLVESLSLAVGAFSSTGNLVSSSLTLNLGEAPSDSVLIILSVVGLASRIELLVLLAAFSKLRW